MQFHLTSSWTTSSRRKFPRPERPSSSAWQQWSRRALKEEERREDPNSQRACCGAALRENLIREAPAPGLLLHHSFRDVRDESVTA